MNDADRKATVSATKGAYHVTNRFKMTRAFFSGGAAVQALALLGAGVGMTAVAAPAMAQDYTSGAISGTVTDADGKSVGGSTVTITSVAQGTVRTATTSASGSFLINGLPVGAYNVAVDSAGSPKWRADGVSILASQTAQLTVQLAAAGGTDIVVTGTRAVTSFSGATSGLNIDVSDFIKTRPLGRDLTSIVLLAPGVTVGNSSNATFNGLPSIGGGSVAENAYYLNGLNLTNFDNYLGGATVPFYFYKSVEVKDGGQPAEYGRATGGIVNATTKSGTNEFIAAVHIDWAPNFLRSKSDDLLSASTNPDGSVSTTRSTNRQYDRADSLLTTVEAGGPIIKDRLFVYGMAQFTRTTSLVNSPLAGLAYRYKNDDPFWGVKVDAYPIDSQHLEFTIFDTRNTNQRSDLAYSATNNVPSYGSAAAVTNFYGGGLNFVGKYTGRMTDWLTVSAAYGRVKDRFDNASVAGAGNLPYFANSSGVTTYGVANGGLYNGQAITSSPSAYNTERKFFRADADISFHLLGDHHIRGGYDQEVNTLNHVSTDNGGAYQFANGAISAAAYNALLGNGGINYFARAANAIGPVIELNYFNTGGTFRAKNKAYYVQDEWKVTDRMTLDLGARRDDFLLNKPSGLPLENLKGNYAPRVSATYQLFGNKSGKIYASYGWYFDPIASNTAYREGSPSYYFRQRYQFQGVNPTTGLPILGALVTNQGPYQTACPFALVPNGAVTNCSVTGNGNDIATGQGFDANLKATRESEITAGYQQRLGLWSFGLSYIHRHLDRTAEDSAIDAAVNSYCAANNIVAHSTTTGAAIPCTDIWSGFNQYVVNNPGSPITVNLLAPGTDLNNRTVTFTAAQLGYGPAKRTYDAVTLEFERKWNGVFSLGGSYTLSKSKGNIEGGVESDFGQADTGITQDFDQPGFVPGSYGNLPNDHRHQIKLFGTVALNDAFTMGLNTQIESPHSFSCFGFNPSDAFANVYGAASHYCNGVLSPRGTASQSDWFYTVNLQLRYTVKVDEKRNIAFRADVFNLTNAQAILNRYQFGDLDVVTGANGLPSSYIPDPNYGQTTLYQPPRYVRLGVDISF